MKGVNVMPPSGFNSQQIEMVTSFVESCVRALREECDVRGEVPAAALKREIGDVTGLLNEPENGFARPVLELLLQVYGSILGDSPATTADLDAALARVLWQVGSSLSAVHVPGGETS